MILGVDPGKTGGLALITADGTLVEALEMPETPWSISDELARMQPKLVVIEKAQAFPGQGVCSVFNYGVSFGILQGIVCGLNLPFVLVEPRRWTKSEHIGCTADSAKGRSLQACQRMFPRFDIMRGARKRKPHEGIVDAILIANYGRKHLYGRPIETEARDRAIASDS